MKHASSAQCLRLCANWPDVGILFEDTDLLALDKPAGLPIAPDRRDKSQENLIGLLHAGIHLKRPWARERRLDYLANVHRLDAGTSGIVLLARNKPALTNLVRQFRSQQPKTTYLALVEGTLPNPEMEVNLPLAPSLVKLGLSAVDRGRGKSALTKFSLVESFKGYSLVKAEPVTGRLHQIQIHLKEIGCPLVADHDYGTGFPLLLSKLKRDYRMKPEGERPLMARPALHAGRLEFLHPKTGTPLVIESSLPKDFTVAIKYLRKFAMPR